MSRGLQTLFLLCVLIMAAQGSAAQSDSASMAMPADTLLPENATTGPERVDEGPGIDKQVTYFGKDSTVLDLDNQRIYLYGMESYVRYGDLEVKAAQIWFSFEDFTAFARGVPDSTGKLMGRPVFTEGNNSFEEDSLGYNFKTKKGISYGVRTQEGDAYLISQVSKKQANDWVHVRNGMFTTCDRERPHYHFRLSKAIVVPDDKVVSGPLYMKVGKVPTPLALPFGFFPNKRESSHGILLPGYGNANRKGLFFQNLGYYIPIQPYLETKILADVYTRGSWSVRNITNYKRRYRYSGGFNISRTVNKDGFEELPSYFQQTTFNVQWNHTQDAKARPNSRFSANVNLGSSQNFRNNLNSSQQDFLSSTFTSGLQYGRTFPGKPYSMAVAANHTQNTRTRQVQVTLPSLTVNLSRINLLENVFPKSPIGINGSLNYENFLSDQEQNIQLSNLGKLADKLQQGIRLTGNASTSWKLGPYLTLNPNATANGFVAFRQVLPVFNEELGREVLDTLPRMGFASTWNAGITANTRIYGTWIMKKGERLKAVRHLIQPSAGINYTPYQDNTRYGFYGEDGTFLGYNAFDAARFRPGTTREAANVSINVNQNIEAKVRDRSSAKVAYKKVKILEGWRTSTAYNLMADSLNWNNVRMSAFTTIAKNVTLNYDGTYSLYDRDSTGREIDAFLWKTSGKPWRMEGTNLALNFRLKGGSKKEKEEEEPLPGVTPEQQQMIGQNRSSYVDFSVPWNLNVGYNLRLTRQWNAETRQDDNEFTQAVTFRGDVTILKRWAISFDSGYDFKQEKMTTTNIGLHWDLHCWELSANFVPFGIRQSYFVQLNIKSPLLQDLKLQRRGNLGDQQDNLLW